MLALFGGAGCCRQCVLDPAPSVFAERRVDKCMSPLTAIRNRSCRPAPIPDTNLRVLRLDRLGDDNCINPTIPFFFSRLLDSTSRSQ